MYIRIGKIYVEVYDGNIKVRFCIARNTFKQYETGYRAMASLKRKQVAFPYCSCIRPCETGLLCLLTTRRMGYVVTLGGLPYQSLLAERHCRFS